MSKKHAAERTLIIAFFQFRPISKQHEITVWPDEAGVEDIGCSIKQFADHREPKGFPSIKYFFISSRKKTIGVLAGDGICRILGGYSQLVVCGVRRQGHIAPGYDGQRIGLRVGGDGRRVDNNIAEGVLIDFRTSRDTVHLFLVCGGHEAVGGLRGHAVSRVSKFRIGGNRFSNGEPGILDRLSRCV